MGKQRYRRQIEFALGEAGLSLIENYVVLLKHPHEEALS